MKAFLARPFAHVVIVALAMIPALAIAAAASYQLQCTTTQVMVHEVPVFRSGFQ